MIAALGLAVLALIQAQLSSSVKTAGGGAHASSQHGTLGETRAIRLELQTASYREGKKAADIADALRSKLLAAGFKVVDTNEADHQAVLRVNYDELKGRAFQDGFITNISVQFTVRHVAGPAVFLDKTVHIYPVGNLIFAVYCPPWCDEKTAYAETVSRLGNHPVYRYLGDYIKSALRLTPDGEGAILVRALQAEEKPTADEAFRLLLDDVPNADRDSIVPHLVTLLGDTKTSTDTRSKAATILGRYKATDRLLELLDNPGQKDIHHAVAEALGASSDRRAVDKLIAVLQREDVHRDVRSAAASALGQLGDTRAIDPLIRALNDSYLGTAVATALGALKDPRGVEPLIELLKSRNNDVKIASARALGRIGDTRALQPLQELEQTDINQDVRTAATEALRLLRGDKIIIREEP